jgi:hypothetical protein
MPSVSASRQTPGRDGGASGEAGHPLGGDAPVGEIGTKKGMSRQRVQAGSVSLERLGQDESGDLISTLARRGTLRPEWLQSTLEIVTEIRQRESTHE